MRLRAAGIPGIFARADLESLGNTGHPQYERVIKALRRYCEQFERFRTQRTGFLFTGGAGTGKTSIACAMAKRLIERGYTARYLSLTTFTFEVRATYGANASDTRESVKSMLERTAAVDLLILDEIDLHGTSMSDFQMLYELINARYSAGNLPVIAISNRPKSFLVKDLGDRLVSRILGSSAEIDFTWPSFREQKAPSGAARPSHGRAEP